MAISNTKIHENLVALSMILTANKHCLGERFVKTLTSEADIIQILRFTASINGICDGLQQAKRMDDSTGEYKETIDNIYANIKCINDIGVKFGFDDELIPILKHTKDIIEVATIIHQNVAFPYLLNKSESSNIDYAEYLVRQEERHFFARTIKQLNSQLSQNEQHIEYAKNYWMSQIAAVNNYNQLAYIFINGLDMIAKYENHVNSYEHINSDTMDLLKRIVQTEKKMLKAGHVSKKRQEILDVIINHHATHGEILYKEATRYFNIAQVQKQEQPTFTIGDLESCSGIMKSYMNTMNEYLRKMNVMPMTTSMSALDVLKAGKSIYDFTNGIIKASTQNIDNQYGLAVQRCAEDIIEPLKMIRDMAITKSETEQQLFENAQQYIVEIVAPTIKDESASIASGINNRGRLTMLNNASVLAIGKPIFSIDPQRMLDIEVRANVDALKNAINKLKNDSIES